MPRHFNDLAYAGRSPRNVLDLAVPDGVARPPLVVFIHGGAFFMGSKVDAERERAALLDAGFAVASVNYRYSTDAIWPAQLDDLKDAFAWLKAKAGDYGVDAERMACFGPSAGGHLSASIAIALSANPDTRLDAAIVWYPPVDFPTMDGDIEATGVPRATGRNDAPDSPESMLIGGYVAQQPDLARMAGPVARLAELPIDAELPDMLVMHGALDPYIAARQSRRLFSALAAFGTGSRLMLDILPEGTHGGEEFEDAATMAKVITFLKTGFERAAARSARRTG